MKVWKTFLPESGCLTTLFFIDNAPYFVDQKNDPKWETVYFQSGSGKWISLRWNYFDIEFKFETYGITIEVIEIASENLVKVGEISKFSKIGFFIKTEWTRPTVQGEVPPNFEQVIEESGSLSKIPENAISAGTSLYALVFSQDDDESKLMICIDDNNQYCLRSTQDPIDIKAVIDSCDAFTLEELLAWKPPL